MTKIINFAAIDIGSNAARLLIASANANTAEEYPVKSILLRYPLRLGEDVFKKGEISKTKIQKTVLLMKTYKNLLQLYDIVMVRACATSAMREAKNGAELVKQVKEKTVINIEIIDGKEEAKIIFDSHIADMLDPQKNYLYVDVGGGSTEISIISKGSFKNSKSFNIGTLRILSGKVKKSDFDRMTKWLKSNISDYQQLEIIGSGGNINKLYRLAGFKEKDKLPVEKLAEVYKNLANYTLEERIEKLKLRPDRADVIIPASEIFMTVSQAANVEYINVPTIGLSDGIIRSLYTDYLKTK